MPPLLMFVVPDPSTSTVAPLKVAGPVLSIVTTLPLSDRVPFDSMAIVAPSSFMLEPALIE